MPDTTLPRWAAELAWQCVELHQHEKHSTLLVRVNQDGTWTILKAAPVAKLKLAP